MLLKSEPKLGKQEIFKNQNLLFWALPKIELSFAFISLWIQKIGAVYIKRAQKNNFCRGKPEYFQHIPNEKNIKSSNGKIN